MLYNKESNNYKLVIRRTNSVYTTLAGNVFWVAESVISMGANSILKGTLIANNGANSLGANSNLGGRMFQITKTFCLVPT